MKSTTVHTLKYVLELELLRPNVSQKCGTIFLHCGFAAAELTASFKYIFKKKTNNFTYFLLFSCLSPLCLLCSSVLIFLSLLCKQGNSPNWRYKVFPQEQQWYDVEHLRFSPDSNKAIVVPFYWKLFTLFYWWYWSFKCRIFTSNKVLLLKTRSWVLLSQSNERNRIFFCEAKQKLQLTLTEEKYAKVSNCFFSLQFK